MGIMKSCCLPSCTKRPQVQVDWVTDSWQSFKLGKCLNTPETECHLHVVVYCCHLGSRGSRVWVDSKTLFSKTRTCIIQDFENENTAPCNCRRFHLKTHRLQEEEEPGPSVTSAIYCQNPTCPASLHWALDLLECLLSGTRARSC